MSVWDDLVGQERVIDEFRAAVNGDSMTHAWLVTGPPGSGRSNAAVAFAAALQCPTDGCGDCAVCRQVLARTHPDVAVIDTDGLSIGVDEVRRLVRSASMSPAVGSWQIIVVEDADRLTEQAANAMLKSIEEPAPVTIWILCAPAVSDVMTTIRSRCRPVLLRTPSASAIAELLMRRDGVSEELAHQAAAISQGHIGRARAMARDEEVRHRRADVMAIPTSLRSVGDALGAAARVEAEAAARAKTRCDALDEAELANLQTAWGVEPRGKRPTGYAGALNALTKEQSRRRKRSERDAIDGVLLDLLSFYRDVLTVQLSTGAPVVNADVSGAVRRLAETFSPEQALAAVDAIVDCRQSLSANAAPLLALENMMMKFLP